MESTGMIAAAVYVLLLTFFAPLPYYSHFLPPTSSIAASSKDSIVTAQDAGVAFPHHSLSTYVASLLSLLIATFLGFLDDLFDIRWRYKLPIPSEICRDLRYQSRAEASFLSHCLCATAGRLLCGTRSDGRGDTAHSRLESIAQHRAY